MRIIYDPSPSDSRTSLVAPRGRIETVLIISPRRRASDEKAEDARSPVELSLSPEAAARDREVRAHENAHLALLGGAAASPVIYDTAVGPGGETVAVGGRIAVDLSAVPGNPEATLRKARSIIAAANAPADPSAADLRTAARAYQLADQAFKEIDAKRRSAVSPNIDIRV